jgi:hypothetical protein
VHTKIGERTVFLVECKQAGIFEIRHIPQELTQQIIGIQMAGTDHLLPAQVPRGLLGTLGKADFNAANPCRQQLVEFEGKGGIGVKVEPDAL